MSRRHFQRSIGTSAEHDPTRTVAGQCAAAGGCHLWDAEFRWLFFDPANGYVPGGSGPQPIATVVDPGIEFRYLNGYSGINANMTDNMVTLTQFGATGNSLSSSNSWYISFTNQDSADDFLGAELVSSDVPGATWSVLGNALILSQPGYSTTATSVSMTFRLITETSPPAVPEPGTLALLGGGLGLGALKRLRRRRVH